MVEEASRRKQEASSASGGAPLRQEELKQLCSQVWKDYKKIKHGHKEARRNNGAKNMMGVENQNMMGVENQMMMGAKNQMMMGTENQMMMGATLPTMANKKSSCESGQCGGGNRGLNTANQAPVDAFDPSVASNMTV